MRSIDDHQRFFCKTSKRPGHFAALNPSLSASSSTKKTLIPERFNNADGDGGIFNLILSPPKGDENIAVLILQAPPAIKPLPLGGDYLPSSVFNNPVVTGRSRKVISCRDNVIKRCSFIRGAFLQDPFRSRIMDRGKQRDALLDYTGLLIGDLLQGGTKDMSMITAYVGDNRNQWRDNIGCIQPPPSPVSRTTRSGADSA